jgi:hypothetical protein
MKDTFAFKSAPNKACTPANCAGAEKPDGWWAPRFELYSSEQFGSVLLVGSPSRR